MNVMIVDMIEGFTRIGALSSPRVAALIPKQVAFIERIPEDSLVVFACDCHGPDDSEFKRMPKHCEYGTAEAAICPELLEVVQRRKLKYIIVPKTTHSAFFQTGLDNHPEFVKAGDHWVMFGCVTDVCITANVIELDYRGKNTTVLRDLVDTYEITKEHAPTPAHIHEAETINDFWFNCYLPGVWGAKITTSTNGSSMAYLAPSE
jgi:nicotinamidase-related amidase